MSAYTEFFLKAPSSVVQLECLEISHSLFTDTFYIVRNAPNGITVTHENSVQYEYTYYPMRVSLTGPRDDLDHILRVELGDLGELVPEQLDAIRAGDGFDEYPRVVYRTYRSDLLTQPLYGPLVLEVSKFDFTREGCAFDAKAPSININRTGERYALGRFPMLRGLL